MSKVYIMKAHHIYEDVRAPRVEHLLEQAAGGFILFGRRYAGKGDWKDPSTWPTFAACSAGQPGNNYAVEDQHTYTIDTGNGYRNNGYEMVVEGWITVTEDGKVDKQYGKEFGLRDKVNAYVFK